MLPYFVGGVDSANIGVLFLLALGHALAGVGGFIVFPVAIGASAINAILAIHQAHAKKKKTGKHDGLATSNAVITTITSLGIIAAIICTFVGSATLMTVAPYILTGVLSLKTLYNLCGACFCWYKYCKYRKIDTEKADQYYEKAKELTIGFVASALLTGAAAGVLIANKSAFGALGIAGGAIGVGYSVYAGYKCYKKYKARSESVGENDIEIGIVNTEVNQLTNNASLHSNLGYAQSPEPKQETLVISQINSPSTNIPQPFFAAKHQTTHTSNDNSLPKKHHSILHRK